VLVESGISKEILNGISTKEISNDFSKEIFQDNISKEIFLIISQTKEIFQIKTQRDISNKGDLK